MSEKQLTSAKVKPIIESVRVGCCSWLALGFFLALTGMSGAAFSAEAAVAGRVLSASGVAAVESSGGSRRVAESGNKVFSGETLVTGADGRMQVKFVDHGLISLRPETRFRIDEFEFDPAVGRGRSFFGLVKGGFRAITGTIGKKSPDDYRITTPVATLGVRGTDFGAILCAAACVGRFDGFLPGLYVRVNQGVVVAKQVGGELLVRAGQVAFVKDSVTLPVLLSKLPPESFWSLKAGTAAGTTTGAGSAAAFSVPAMVGAAALIVVPVAVTSGSSGGDRAQSPE